jgi:mercuric ion transport protein
MAESKQDTDLPRSGADGTASLLSHLGLGASIAALIGASCCALPLVLASLGLAGAWIANLGILIVYRPYITGIALAVIAAGWAIALRRRAPGRTFLVLGLSTAVVLAALVVTEYEPQINRYLVALWRG